MTSPTVVEVYGTGPQGLAGPRGYAGPQGVQGPAGQPGATGVDGATGVPGVIGPPGPAGAAGASGATGVAGTVGPQGAPGQGFVMRGPWQPFTAYNPYDLVTYNGQTFYTVIPGGLDATFNLSGNWLLFADRGPAGIGQSEIAMVGPASVNQSLASIAWTDVTGLTGLVVPQGTGNFKLEVFSGIKFQLVTGTTATNTLITTDMQIVDDLGAVVWIDSCTVISTGSSRIETLHLFPCAPVPASAVAAGARTYKVQARLATWGVTSQAETLLFTGTGLQRYFQARLR